MKAPFATRGFVGGLGWRLIRRLVQALALYAIVVAPLLGGWQRLDRGEMAAWDSAGFDLPAPLRAALPLGDAPARAHAANLVKGGGIGFDVGSIAMIDPATGVAALLVSEMNARALIALALPILFALVAGRVFCGWLCPFGVLARLYDGALALIPFRHRIAIPKRRPLRWLILAVGLAAGLLGTHLLLYLALPYLLVQQSIYAAWLLGGGSAVLGLFAGFLLAGGVLGPTTYCATLCPTGGVLALLGRTRRVHITLQAPKACGKSCGLCSSACWLQLDPASGDPGPDCDACARCFPACPRTNLVATLQKPRRTLPIVTAAAVLLSLAAAERAEARGDDKPMLLIDGERLIGEVLVAVSVVDLSGVDLDHDAVDSQVGAELSVYLVRGPRRKANARGLLPSRDVYSGPLSISIERRHDVVHIPFDGPNSPASTPRHTLFRSRLPYSLVPGDRVTVPAVPGWLEQPVHFHVPRPGNQPGALRLLGFALAGLLLTAGLLSLALAVPPRRVTSARG